MVGEHTYDLHPWPVFCICLVVGSGPGLDVFRCQGDLGEGGRRISILVGLFWVRGCEGSLGSVGSGSWWRGYWWREWS